MAKGLGLPSGAFDGLTKLTSRPTDGLDEEYDSIAYRVAEIERHLHNSNECYGNDGANNFERMATAAFRITAGAGGAFGTELQVHDGTVVGGGDADKRMDVGTFFVPASQANDQTYVIELWAGTGTFGEAGKITEFYYRTGANISEVVPIIVPCPRRPCNYKLWVRCKCSLDSQWVDLLFMVHVYDG